MKGGGLLLVKAVNLGRNVSVGVAFRPCLFGSTLQFYIGVGLLHRDAPWFPWTDSRLACKLRLCKLCVRPFLLVYLDVVFHLAP